MANKTNNYKLPKPEVDDFYDISEYNKTMDMLDDSLTEMDQKKLDKNGDASEAVTEFEQEILRENIESGEKLSTTFGKVKKWFSEMKDVAFSGHAKDIATDATHRFVSDAEKSSWNGKVGASGGDISETVIGSLQSIATEFPIPEQGETSKVFFGKVKKFIKDFNNFKSGIITIGSLVNNGNATSEGYALDARYGKTLFDLYTKLNSDLGISLTSALSIADTSHFKLDSWAANGIERKGKVIHFHCHFILLKQITDWNEYVLVNLPAQFKTSQEFNGEKYVSYNSSPHLFQYFVRTSGTVSLKIDNNAPAGTACTLDFTYFVN